MSLILQNLTKSFNKKLLFENFSYEFPDIGIFSLEGESGVGKTTLLRMIAGLDNKYKGKILGGGFTNISFAFQEYRLFPNLSARDNIAYVVNEEANEKLILNAEKALLKLGFLKEDTLLFPDELSGGMKQRVALARAFEKKSKVLILDEPTKELDEENRKNVLDYILKESKQRLIILVSHNKNDAEYLGAVKINF